MFYLRCSNSIYANNFKMKKFKIGDKVRIKDVPKEHKDKLNMKGVVIPIGETSYPRNDVMVKLENGELARVKEHQLAKA